MKIIRIVAKSLMEAMNKINTINIGECTALITKGNFDAAEEFIKNNHTKPGVYDYVIIANVKYMVTTKEWVKRPTPPVIMMVDGNVFSFETVEKAKSFVERTNATFAVLENCVQESLTTNVKIVDTYPDNILPNEKVEALNEYVFYCTE